MIKAKWEFLFCHVSRNDPQNQSCPWHVGGGCRPPRTPPALVWLGSCNAFISPQKELLLVPKKELLLFPKKELLLIPKKELSSC